MKPTPASSMTMLAVMTSETSMLSGLAAAAAAISVAAPAPATCW